MSSRSTPFCTVCHAAGKSMEEYTSHYVKNQPGPHGVVVCPTLLSQECRYCHERGHTPKFCPMLINRRKTKRVASYRSPQVTQEMSANQRRQVEREAEVLNQQQLKVRTRRIESILYEKHYWFDPLRREEEIKECLFAQALFRLSDEQLARMRKWVDGEERFSATFHTWYSLADEQEAMDEADREFEYLNTKNNRPTLTLGEKGDYDEIPNVLWRGVSGHIMSSVDMGSKRSPLPRPKLKRSTGAVYAD